MIRLLFFCLSMTTVVAQRSILKGTVAISGYTTSAVFVQNATTEQETQIAENGSFEILCQADDLLLFYGEGIDFFRVLVEENHFKLGMRVNLTAKAIPLEEVQIANYDGMMAGIIGYTPKRYTVAERRFKRIASLDPSVGLGPGVGGVSFSLDPIMNKLNGGIRKYKRALDAERAEIARQRVFDKFDATELAKRLKIDKQQVEDMVRFAAEEPEFQKIAKEATDSALLFQLSRYWVIYQEHLKK
ncbi:hypothetical protein [Flavobacterium sp.]|uniref:hypothetical protein n=1 Tax=Flavobacterium sp. TaxID=239 RepID=UPI00261BAB98|nr:hypothetical protein [Flavobacterium sp.]